MKLSSRFLDHQSSRRLPLHLELLEAREQPGSLLPWQTTWSDLDLSLAAQERDGRQARNYQDQAVQLRSRAEADTVAVVIGAVQSDREQEPGEQPIATPVPVAPAADLLRVAASQPIAVRPVPDPGTSKGTPIMATEVRTGLSRPSGLTMQLEQVTPEAVDLQATPGWFSRPIDFKVVPFAEGGIGIQAQLDWTTFLTGTDAAAAGRAVTLDAAGNSYVTGWLEAGGERWGFAAKYDLSGAIQYGFWFQAQDNLFQYQATEPRGIAVDAEGNAYIGGTALRGIGTITDGFALKIDATGTEVVYGYAHGQLLRSSEGTGIALDSFNRAYVTGNTLPPGYALPQAFMGRYSADPNPNRPMDYAGFYVVRTEKTEYSSSTANAIAVDPIGTFVYLGGGIVPAQLDDTDMFGFKVLGANGAFCGLPLCYAFTTPPNLGADAFEAIAINEAGEAFYSGTLVVKGTTPNGYVSKVNTTGTDSPWAVLFVDTDHAYGVAYDGVNTYASGSANDTANLDAFAVKLDPTGQQLDGYSIDGSGNDIAYALAYRPETGTAYLTGSTTSPEITTDGSFLYGLQEGFLASIGAWM